MKKIWALCMWEIKIIFNNRSNYLIMFAMPLIFTLLFGQLFKEDEESIEKILVVDQDQSMLSESFVTALKQDNSLFQVEVATETIAMEQLKDMKIPVVITIDKGFETELFKRIPELKFHRTPDFTASEVMVEYVGNKLSEAHIRAVASKEWGEVTGENWETMHANLQKQPTKETFLTNTILENNEESQDNISRSASGFSIMFLMISVMSVIGTILEARKNGVWQRLMTVPASRLEIALGYLLSFFIIGWIQFGTLMIAVHFIFGVNWGKPVLLLIMVSSLMLAVVGLGLLIAAIVKTVEQQSLLSNLLVITTCMVAGVFWPLEIQPLFMQKIAEFLPQTWAMRGFESIASEGTLLSILDSVGILLLFAIIFLLIGIRKIQF